MLDRQKLLVGLKHPRRRRMLELMLRRRQPLSPAAIAGALDLPPSAVGYHVRVLADVEMVQQVPGPAWKGSREHRYRLEPEVAADGWVREALELPRSEEEGGEAS